MLVRGVARRSKRSTLKDFIVALSVAASLASVTFGASNVYADDAKQCTSWRSGGKGYEKLELRTCARAEPEASAEGKSEDSDDTYELEVKSGYDKPLEVRFDIATTDGKSETVEADVKPGSQVAGECTVCRDHKDVKSIRVGKTQSDKDEPLRKVKGTMHMEIKARDLRLTDANAKRLERIASRYYKATRKRLVITGGSRTPIRQAQLMYDKLVHGDDIVALYENKAAATEVRNAYRDAVAKRAKRKATIRAIREVIEAQMSRGVHVSKHLKANAVDVRSWNMKGRLEDALKEAVKAEAGVTMMDERDGAEPHFHLNLP
ncbi:MAG TPA: hypothetical protein PK156_12995 [Polyangium sp.]|nr:hypothetical protein [Polyangium sp.]